MCCHKTSIQTGFSSFCGPHWTPQVFWYWRLDTISVLFEYGLSWCDVWTSETLLKPQIHRKIKPWIFSVRNIQDVLGPEFNVNMQQSEPQSIMGNWGFLGPHKDRKSKHVSDVRQMMKTSISSDIRESLRHNKEERRRRFGQKNPPRRFDATRFHFKCISSSI